MKNYINFRSDLRAWVNASGMSLQGACTELSSRLARKGIDANPFTFRHHVMGQYRDVGLNLASAVWEEIGENRYTEWEDPVAFADDDAPKKGKPRIREVPDEDWPGGGEGPGMLR
jgi:hypothetical protein